MVTILATDKGTEKDSYGYVNISKKFPSNKEGRKGMRLNTGRTHFKKGHAPWNKGKKGIHLSPKSEFKKGLCSWHKGTKGLVKPNSGSFKKGIIPWCKGKKVRLNPSGEFKKGHISPLKGKHLSEETKQKLRESKSKQIMPLKDTLPERMLQQKLTDNRIVFEKHKAILGQPDVFIEPNICIFVDGCYWHGCEQCLDRNKLESWIRGKRVRDEIITQKLINDGYIVLRFWEHEIHNDIDSCIDQIKNNIEGVKICKL